MFNKRSSRRIPFVLSLPVLSPTEGSKYVRAAMPVTPLLILAAAALVALAVFFANYDAPPASADHTSTKEVWSSTLTVGNWDALVGCDDSQSSALCSSALTDNEFTFEGTSYRITAIRVSPGGALGVEMNRTIPASLRSKLTMHVGNRQFALFSNSSVGSGASVGWNNAGLSWSVGDTVQLRPTVPVSQTNPPLPTLTASFSPDGPVWEDWETNTARDLWSPTLTVRELSPATASAPAIVGCDDSKAGAACRSALTDRDFTFNGVAYTVRGISYNEKKAYQDPNNPFNIIEHRETLKLTLNKAIPESFRSCLTLHSGNAKVPFADDGVAGAGVDTALSASNGVANSTLTVTAIGALNAGAEGWGLNWSAGQTVKPRLPNVGCLTLTLSEAVTEETSMQIRFIGTASNERAPDADYRYSKLPTFAVGSTMASRPIEVIDDSRVEGCETITLDMTMWPGTDRAVHTSYTVAIQDDDGGNACSGGM